MVLIITLIFLVGVFVTGFTSGAGWMLERRHRRYERLENMYVDIWRKHVESVRDNLELLDKLNRRDPYR